MPGYIVLHYFVYAFVCVCTYMHACAMMYGVEIRTQITGISSFLLLGRSQDQVHIIDLGGRPLTHGIISLALYSLFLTRPELFFSCLSHFDLLPPSRTFSCSDNLSSFPFRPNSSDCHQITPRLGSVLPCPHEYLWELKSAFDSSSPFLRLFLVFIFSLQLFHPTIYTLSRLWGSIQMLP